MKTILLALFGLCIVTGFCMAQAAPGTMSQNVQVILEMQTAGLYAAHSDIQAGTEIKITNEANGKVITAIAAERLPKSYGRVVNLSPDAARQLGVVKGDWVKVTVPYQRPLSQTAPANTDAIPGQPGGNVTINNYYYVFDPDKLPELANKSFDLNKKDTPREAAPVMPKAPELPGTPVMLEAPELVETPELTEAPELAEASEVTETPQKPENSEIGNQICNVQADEIQIIGLPDPHSDKYYRLQIGAFFNVDLAHFYYQKVADGGFNPGMEDVEGVEGVFYRVSAANIAASDVLAEAYRLGALGFMEIWVREEK